MPLLEDPFHLSSTASVAQCANYLRQAKSCVMSCTVREEPVFSGSTVFSGQEQIAASGAQGRLTPRQMILCSGCPVHLTLPPFSRVQLRCPLRPGCTPLLPFLPPPVSGGASGVQWMAPALLLRSKWLRLQRRAPLLMHFGAFWACGLPCSTLISRRW